MLLVDWRCTNSLSSSSTDAGGSVYEGWSVLKCLDLQQDADQQAVDNKDQNAVQADQGQQKHNVGSSRMCNGRTV